MAFDLNYAIGTMYPAATAAYQIMANPAPALPADFVLVGRLIADPDRAAAAMAAATPTQQSIAAGMVAESNVFGLVAWNAATSTALVAFRGTQTLPDWIHNLDAVPVPYIPDPGSGFVHMGFQLVYEHISAHVRELLANCAGMQRIAITGHSLGGAVAVLSAIDIRKNMGFGLVPTLYTFAGPRAGAPDFAASFNADIPALYRIVNFGDLVPEVPVRPLYEHAGQAVTVYGGFQPFNPVFAHSLTTYLVGMQKLQAG